MKKDKAIVFTAFDRVDYLRETLNAWSKVRDLDKFDIYFRVEPSKKNKEILSVIKSFKNSVKANVFVDINDELLGCARNTHTVLSQAFKKYRFVILAEDDVTPSADLAQFFIELDKRYQDDKTIGAIVANHEEPENDPTKFSKIDFFRGLIWATWKYQWDTYLRDTWDFDYSTAGEEGLSGWDWHIALRIFPQNNLKVLVPHASRSQHIGVFGIHSDDKSYHEGVRQSYRDDFIWDSLTEAF